MEITKHRAPSAWWSHLVNGLLLLGLGIAALSYPGPAYRVLSVHFAVVIVSNGVLGSVFAWTNRHQLLGWSWLLALELTEVGLGIIAFRLPAGDPLRPVLTSGWLLYRAVLILCNAVVLHRWHQPGWGWVLAVGLAGNFFALVLLISPHLYGSPAVAWLALGLGACGVAGIILAFQLRRNPTLTATPKV